MEIVDSKNNTVFVSDEWYIIKGGYYINAVVDRSQLVNGVDIQQLDDVDSFTLDEQINTFWDFMEAIVAFTNP